jgi:hypothetical protein
VRHWTARVILLATVAVAGSGCRSHIVGTAPKSYEQLGKIGSAYRKATDVLDRAPANLPELLPFLKEYGGDPATLLRSPDDNEDYVILWGVDYRSIQPLPVTVYEKIGVNGRRQVLRAHVALEMTDEEFRRAPFPPGYKCPL